MGADVVLLKVEFAGTKTVAELEKMRRVVTAIRKDQVIGTQDYLKAANLEVQIKNKLHDLNSMAYSDNAKMKESYFKLGTELRGVKLAAMGVADSMGFTRGGMGFVFSALAGPGGVIAGVITGVTGLVLFMTNLSAETKALNTELNDLTGKQLVNLTASLEELDRRKASGSAITAGILGRILGPVMGAGIAGAGSEKDRMQRKVDLAKLGFKNEEEAAAALQMLRMGVNPQGGNVPIVLPMGIDPFDLNAEREAKEREKAKDAIKKEREEWNRLMEAKKKAMFVGPFPGGVDRAGRPLGANAWRPKQTLLPWVEARGTSKADEEEQKIKTIKLGAIEAGQAISQYIGGALSRSLSIGQQLGLSLFKIAFVTALNFAAPGTGAGSIAGSFLPFAKGGIIPEPVLGRGMKSGKGYVFGEAGPERVTPMVGKNRSGGDAGMAQAVNRLADSIYSGLRLNYKDIALAANIGGRRLRSGSM